MAATLAVIEILLIASLWRRWSPGISLSALVQDRGAAFYSALFLPILPAFYSPVLRRQKRLLEEGEIGIAMVNSRYRRGRRGPYYVTYSFRDVEGNTVEGDSIDSTDLLRPGSGMLVYYDPNDTDGQVAQCAAYYEVNVPGFSSDYIDQVG